MTLHVTTTPTAGRFYQVQNSDTWLGLIGRAYGARSGSNRRLALSKMANNHPNNWRLHRAPKNEFERTHYPDGLVSLSRKFSCSEADFETPPQNKIKSGSCRPIVYIPPEDDVWLNRPPEVVQANIMMCWAAALSSLSRARPLTRRFGSQTSLAKSARRKLEAMTTKGRLSIVTPPPDFGLRVIPLGADVASGMRSGEASIALVGAFLGLSYTPFFGDAGPGVLQGGVDNRISVAELANLLDLFKVPIILFRSNPGSPGHVTVVFGASVVDDVYFEMDPFQSTSSGKVFGRRRTRVVRSGANIGSDPSSTPSQEIYVMF